MKAGIIVDNEFNNDARVRREAMILKSAGYDVHVLCLGFGKEYKNIEGISISRILINRKLKDTLFFFQNAIPLYESFWARKISGFISSVNPDIIHVHDLYMSKAAHSGIKRSGRKIPMILDLHENYPFQVTTYNWTKGFLRNLFSKPGAWKKKESEYLGYADKIVVLSREYMESLMSEYPYLHEDMFIVFPNVPDLTAPEYTNKKKFEKPFGNDFPVLLYYGIIAERRGIFETLKVFSDIVSNGYNVNLLLIGPIDKKDKVRFNELSSGNYLTGKLKHIPWIESKDFPGYLDISDICLAPFRKNPQHESGIANKIYDYMLGGKPLIVSDCRPQANLVEKFKCGLVFRNNEEYSVNILTLLDDEELRKSMGRNGQNAIINKYNSSTFSGGLLSAYGELKK
ncbi:MAG TPA: glycosyltransferase family 4 protein [Bacteroidales bacterium]|nr:glycosyltransferase family 4 protein [Bacteroidales bacterium]